MIRPGSRGASIQFPTVEPDAVAVGAQYDAADQLVERYDDLAERSIVFDDLENDAEDAVLLGVLQGVPAPIQRNVMRHATFPIAEHLLTDDRTPWRVARRETQQVQLLRIL